MKKKTILHKWGKGIYAFLLSINFFLFLIVVQRNFLPQKTMPNKKNSASALTIKA